MSFDNKYFESEDVWDVNRVLGNAQELKRFTMTLDVIPESINNLLDVGCGNGAFMYFVEQNTKPNKIQLNGLESSKVAIENRVSKAEIVESDITKMPFKNSEYDVVSALEVLEHMSYQDLAKACSEMQRVSSKYILVSVPYKEKRVFATCPECSCKFSPIYHLRSFDDDLLEGMFSEYKLVKKKYVTIESFYFAEYLRKANYEYRIKWENELVCPQCGYSTDTCKDEKVSHIEINNPPLIEMVKKLIPKKKRPHWVICLYERK